jgi:hypothetical protein
LIAPLHHHHRVGLAGIGGGRGQALGVLARVLELERIDRRDLGTDLDAALGIEQQVEPAARAQAVVMAALRAHAEVALEVGAVQHRLAGPRTCSTALRGSTCCAPTNRRA